MSKRRVLSAPMRRLLRRLQVLLLIPLLSAPLLLSQLGFQADSALALLLWFCGLLLLLPLLRHALNPLPVAAVTRFLERVNGTGRAPGQSLNHYLLGNFNQLEKRLLASLETAEQQLEKSTLLHIATNNLVTPIIVFDAQWGLLFMNKAMEQWLLEHAEDVQSRIEDFDPQEPLMTLRLDRLIKTEGVDWSEVYSNKIGIGRSVVHYKVTQTQGRKGHYYYVAAWEDITKERLVERRMEDMLSQMIYGDLSNEMDVSDITGFMHFLGISINRLVATVKGPVDGLLEVLPQIEQGDLGTLMEGEYKGEYLKIQQSLNGMLEQLREMMVRVKESNQALEAHAATIARGNLELSQRFQQQTGALDRVAEAVARSSSQLSSSLQGAEDATTRSTSLRHEAQQGTAVVQQAVAAMEGISESSQRIADIIGVIDGIAFQTNLLALNAAVEAARAGEQGRASRWWPPRCARWPSVRPTLPERSRV